MIIILDKISVQAVQIIRANGGSLAAYQGRYAAYIPKRYTKDGDVLRWSDGAAIEIVNHPSGSVEIVAIPRIVVD